MNNPRVIVALTLLNLAFFGGACLQRAGAQEIPDVLRTRKLEIVDEQGRTRASLNVFPADATVTLPNGKPLPETVLLRLIDENGRPSVKLAASNQGAQLALGGAADPTYILVSADLATTSIKLNNFDGLTKTITP